MTRLAQPWIMRYPLIDWHGNMGSQHGDSQAAARYTEARLSKISEQGLLDKIKKNVVDFQSNYSEDELEPITLPSIFPNLLCNPNTGIGFAVACSWNPHNLIEVKDAILSFLDGGEPMLPGPDFPTGGTIINSNEVKNIYKTGKGSVKVRGNYTIEKRGNKKLIVFTEIPYGVSLEKLIEKIAAVCDLKQIMGINEIRDESGKKGLRLVIELEKDAEEENVLNGLFMNTDLQKSISFNQVALVNGKPKLLDLKECIDIYVKHQLDVIAREYSFDLEKAKARLHIVEGLLKALVNIDEIIQLIKNSNSVSEARESLIKQYSLSEIQAKSILDMKLSRLSKLEKLELENEQKELVKKIATYEEILSSKEKQANILKERLKDFCSKFGDKRRTKLDNIQIDKKKKEAVQIIPEKMIIVFTQNGYIKRIPTKSFRTQNRNAKGIKSQTDPTIRMVNTNTVDSLMLFSNAGKMYKINVVDIPLGTNTSKGELINTILQLKNGESIKTLCSVDENKKFTNVLFITRNGFIKKTNINEYTSTNRKVGILATKIKEDDALVDVILSNDEDIVLVSKKGYAIRFNTGKINSIGRNAIGVKGMSLLSGDYIISANLIINEEEDLFIATEDGMGKRLRLKELPLQSRSGKGVIVSKKDLGDTCLLGENDAVMVASDSNSICVKAADIPSVSRLAIGIIIIKSNNIKSVTKI